MLCHQEPPINRYQKLQEPQVVIQFLKIVTLNDWECFPAELVLENRKDSLAFLTEKGCLIRVLLPNVGFLATPQVSGGGRILQIPNPRRLGRDDYFAARLPDGKVRTAKPFGGSCSIVKQLSPKFSGLLLLRLGKKLP